MCTVSWRRESDGYQLFFNRDELRSRKPAAVPRLDLNHGFNTLRPVDGDAGGTWIAVNEFGLCAALLNDYQSAAELSGSFVSRGEIPLLATAAEDMAAARRRLNDLSMSNYRPFYLLLLDAEGQSLANWDGQTLHWLAEPRPPLSSSSWNTEAVVSGRIQQYRDRFSKEPSGKDLQAFQSSHRPEQGAFSVCMHREDACTVSFSHIVCAGDAVQFHYQDGAPCEADTPVTVTLERRR